MFAFEFENLDPLFNSLGWTLLIFLWQGALIALLARVAMICLRNHAANLRYMALCAALLLMLLAPLATFILIHGGNESFLAVNETPLLYGDLQSSLRNNSGSESSAAQNFVESGGINENRQENGLLSFINFKAAFPWFVSLWLAGVSFLSLRLTFDWLTLRKLKRGAAKPLTEWQPAAKRLAGRLGIDKPVLLLESSLVKVPVAVGWLKPLVLLPAGMVFGLTSQQLEAIIAHELAHIRRHDYLVNIFQIVAEILLFYHPAVLWLSKQIRIEREYACDDLAIAACGGDRLVYARALTKVERIRKAAPVLATAASGGSLETRVKRLVDSGYRQPAAGGFSGTLIILTLLAVSVFGWQTSFFGKSAVNLSANDAGAVSPENSKTGEPRDETTAEIAQVSANIESFPGEDQKLRETALSALGNRQGSVIVMNPHTGRLYTVVNQDLAFREEWHPASVFKIVTSFAVLNENKVKGNEKIDFPGLPESLTLNDALAISHNDYFELLGKSVGTNALIATARQFGLGRKTGVNLPGEIAGQLPSKRTDIDAGLLGKYGQGVQVTPMQLAVMTSALANRGLLVRPFAGQPENPPHFLPKLAASSDAFSQIVGGMRSAVERGTGKGAFMESFPAAGKTGTAEFNDSKTGLFASFAPLGNPRFVVVVAIKDKEASGLVAAEIAGEIYRFLGEGGHRPEN